MIRKILITGIICAGFVTESAIFAQEPTTNKKLEVITTLFPTYDFARQVGKDKINVSLLLPPGVEAHSFEPKPSDIVKINKADVFIYTGKYMEPWVENILKGISNKNLLVVDASEGIQLFDEKDANEEGEHREEKTESGHHHQHGGKDPHIWLDLQNAQIMAVTIAKSFSLKDPDNKDFYLKDATEYKTRIGVLDERFKETFAHCKQKTLIYGGHFAFGYFTRRYGLEYVSPYEGFSPNAEPTPKAIAELITTMKKNGIKYIYYEELIDPKVAQTIASETGAQLMLLHGAHNVSSDELKKGITLLEIMEENLKRLKTGLDCK